MEKLFASFRLLQLWGLGMTTTVIRPFRSSVRLLHWKAKLSCSSSSFIINTDTPTSFDHSVATRCQLVCIPAVMMVSHFTCFLSPSLRFLPPSSFHHCCCFLVPLGPWLMTFLSSTLMEMKLFFSHQRSCCLYVVDIDLVMLLGISYRPVLVSTE